VLSLSAQSSPQYVQDKEVQLGAPASCDYLTFDAPARRLLIAHGTKIDIVDADKGEKVGSVEGLDGAHGAVFVPELKLGFATSGRKNTLVVFDPAFKVKKEIATGTGPDALLYVSTSKEVWTMNHRAGTVTCVDAASLEVKATIEVGGALEFAVEWPAKGRVFVNVEDKNLVAEIDVGKHALVKKHELGSAETPTGLALDSAHGILFCGCDKKVAVLDAATGKVLATPAIGQGCDAVAFDAETGLVFASCADGTTTILRGGDSYPVVGKIDTVPGGKTCTLDPKTHVLWVVARTTAKDGVRAVAFAPASAAKAAGAKK
jgi:hypothetical protein